MTRAEESLAATQIMVVLNWLQELERLVPTEEYVYVLVSAGPEEEIVLPGSIAKRMRSSSPPYPKNVPCSQSREMKTAASIRSDLPSSSGSTGLQDIAKLA